MAAFIRRLQDRTNVVEKKVFQDKTNYAPKGGMADPARDRREVAKKKQPPARQTQRQVLEDVGNTRKQPENEEQFAKQIRRCSWNMDLSRELKKVKVTSIALESKEEEEDEDETRPLAPEFDIDADRTDIYRNPHDAQEIVEYFTKLEAQFKLPASFLVVSDIKPTMRSVLVDWLIRVQTHYRLSQMTLHQMVQYLDMALTRHCFKVGYLQLVGITCLLLAAKYTERFPPEIADLCRMTDSTYLPRQVIRMERQLLVLLKFELYAPVASSFLDRYLLVVNEDSQLTYAARYLVDLSLIDTQFMKVALPSKRAAAALYLAQRSLPATRINSPPDSPAATNLTTWTKDLVYYTGYTEAALESEVKQIADLVRRANADTKIQGAFEKYCSRKYDGIARVLRIPSHLTAKPSASRSQKS